MKEYNTIFNHALAPITPGPSSSNTCGPVRIGLVCQQLLGEVPAKAIIEYYSKGAFTTTLYGMRSDVAFINGLMGKEQNDPEFNLAYEKAKEIGMDVSFKEVDDLTVGGMETVRIRMIGNEDNVLTVIGESIGGGAFKIHYIDDCESNISGMNYELLIFVNKDGDVEKSAANIISKVEPINDYSIVYGKDYALIDIKSGHDFSINMSEKEWIDNRIIKIREVKPIHPIVSDVLKKPPFETAEEMIEYCEKKKCSTARAAIDYEIALSGWEENKIRQYANMLIKTMKDSRENGLKKGLTFDGIVTPKAAAMNGVIGCGKKPSLGILNDAIPSALGIMEWSNASGKIVCVPTGGSSGIVPGLLLSAAETMGSSEDELYEALMAAGMIGVLMMVDGNEFAGGTHGCQAEIACGTAMAAAGLVQLMGGTAKECCDAAAMSLQCFLGLICDPVAGLVQVPCLARNIAGVSVAASCAEAVCAGFDVVIPLEEMSRIMVRVGTDITKELGMCCSGCCLTPTGRRLTKEHDEACKNLNV